MVNRLGFTEGDKLLKAVAALLLQAFGKENSCHISADRFAAATTEDGLEERLRRHGVSSPREVFLLTASSAGESYFAAKEAGK